MLAAEDSPRARHLGLDKRVADSCTYGCAAVLTYDLGNGTRSDQVVDDRRPWMLCQLASRDQGRHRRGADDLAALINHEAAICVTIERQADVGACLPDLCLKVAQVFGLDRVRLMVGEVAVELEVHGYDGQGKAGEHRGHRVTAHAV